jgi:hypothetical protein
MLDAGLMTCPFIAESAFKLGKGAWAKLKGTNKPVNNKPNRVIFLPSFAKMIR